MKNYILTLLLLVVGVIGTQAVPIHSEQEQVPYGVTLEDTNFLQVEYTLDQDANNLVRIGIFTNAEFSLPSEPSMDLISNTFEVRFVKLEPGYQLYQSNLQTDYLEIISGITQKLNYTLTCKPYALSKYFGNFGDPTDDGSSGLSDNTNITKPELGFRQLLS
jgi:hypothetical protein